MIRYKKEFKQSLVEMHNQGRSYTDLSTEYGPSVDSIRNWVKLYAVHEVHGEKWTKLILKLKGSGIIFIVQLMQMV